MKTIAKHISYLLMMLAIVCLVADSESLAIFLATKVVAFGLAALSALIAKRVMEDDETENV